MKNILIILIGALVLTSCGGGTEEGEDSGLYEVKSKDVNGTIDADPTGSVDLSHSGDVKSNGKALKFKGKGEISLYLTGETVESMTEKESKSLFYDSFEVVDQADNGLLYFVTKTNFDDEETNGFFFFVLVPNDDETSICLEGRGEEMFDPILKEEDAKELFKAALTFKKK